jgi:hypothetical protein
LAKLIIRAVLRLENAGLRVSGITCDGSSSNKNMWKEFGIGGTTNLVNKVNLKRL